MKKYLVLFGVLLCLAAAMRPELCWAQRVEGAAPWTSDAYTPDPAQASYIAFLHRAATMGPAQINLNDLASLDLPQGYAFVPQKIAMQIMQKMGNDRDKNLIGLVFPADKNSWFMTVEYVPSGYIRDDDARNWDADKMLDKMRQDNDDRNAERVKQGLPAFDIIGWVERPHYEESTHRLIWSLSAREAGKTGGAQDTINYRTLMLGRSGYISMVMVTNEASIEGLKPTASLLLSKLNFDSGKSYADFNASTDHVAEYGLAALVAGVAAKKLGLLAVAVAFIAKFAKLGILAAIAFFGPLRKKFAKAKTATQTVVIVPPESGDKPTLPPP